MLLTKSLFFGIELMKSISFQMLLRNTQKGFVLKDSSRRAGYAHKNPVPVCCVDPISCVLHHGGRVVKLSMYVKRKGRCSVLEKQWFCFPPIYV